MNRNAKIISGIQASTECVAAIPKIASEPWPCCQMSVITPHEAATETMVSSTALSGSSSERKARELAGQAQADLLSPLSESEREQLHDMLRRIVEHVGSAPPWVRQERPPPG